MWTITREESSDLKRSLPSDVQKFYEGKTAREILLITRMKAKTLSEFVRAVSAHAMALPEVNEYIIAKGREYGSEEEEDGDLLYFSRAWSHPELI